MDMESQLLKTKLSVPRLSGGAVSRKKVMEKLGHLLEHRLTLVTAPAGYGKTTAAAAFAASSGVPCAWLSIDEGDNDPVRFWRYVASAVHGKAGQPCGGFSDLPLSRELIESDIFVMLLIERLLMIPGRLVIIFDDYHLIENAVVKKSFEYFVRNIPSNFNVLMLSRSEHDMDRVLVSVKGDALRLDGADLAFDREEITEFYRNRGIALTSDEASAIEAFTEGWAAGVAAAAFAVEKKGSVHDAVCGIRLKSRYVDRFLNDEVFDRWPAGIKTFLIRTSVLDRLSGPLCDAVSGLSGCSGILRRLSECNCFLFSLDAEGEWYRYHHLFREFLRERLEGQGKAFVRSLNGLAGEWYRENGIRRDAIDHFIRAGDHENALPLILRGYLVYGSKQRLFDVDILAFERS